ncbi:MAG TPA: histidine kinase [Gemmatimonadaceae bacterium]|nr:histidine kinase [Gemmatimonadaceae bacterium]
MKRALAVPYFIRPSGFMSVLTDPSQETLPVSLRLRRERAERMMNGLRATVLLLLAIAAVAYAPVLAPELDRTNVMLLVPTMAWSLSQYLLWYRQPHLPTWLPLSNAIVDVTAVTGIIAGYSLSGSGTLALRTPIFMMYFVVLAARPVASSVRKTAFVASLAVVQYSTLLLWLIATGRVDPVLSPVDAIALGKLSYLDEGAKILILAVAGGIATYATLWVEQLVLELETESAERQRVATRLVRSQLDTLRLQLSPHFLFNALNGAMALIGSDSRAAERMLAAISEFLRMILRSSAEPKVTVERELTLLRHYIEIQRVRFGEKLSVRFEVDDSLAPAIVPSLLLQPLVENSIRHGIGPRVSGGTIIVRVLTEGDMLRIDVEDNGIGPSDKRSREKNHGTGLGLSNTATRLNHLYGERHTFETGRGANGGFRVSLTLPLEIDTRVDRSADAELAEVIS